MPTTTGLATSFITFSRPGASGGGATVTDRDGKIKWAGHNLLTNSESFDASAWTKTVTAAANTHAAPNSTTTADTLTASGANQTALQSYTALAVPYTFGVWLKRKTGTGNIQIAADSGTYTTVTITSDWALYTVTQTPAAGTISTGIRIVTSGDEVYAWGAHLYRSDLGGMQLNPAQPAGMQSYYPTTPRNLVGYSEDLSDAYWVKTGLLAFGSGSISNAIVGPNGLQTADFIVPSTGVVAHTLRTTTRTATATSYTASVYAKAGGYNFLGVQYVTDGYAKYYEGVFNLATGVVESTGRATSYTGSRSITPVGNGWYRCSVTVTLSDATASSFVGFVVQQNNDPTTSFAGDGTSGIYLWGAQLSDSASLDTYVPVYGAAVTSAAYYAPRLDFDPVTLAAKGLLVEEARTNVVLHSSDFSNAVWNAGSYRTLQVTTDQTTAPDGTFTADKVVEAAAGAGSVIQRVSFFDTSASAQKVVSVYAKKSERKRIYLFVNGPDDGGWFDLDLGTSGAGTDYPGGTTSITPVGNGWYRCSLTPGGASGSNFVQICVITDTATTLDTRVGDGTSGVFLWGAQLEAGSFATSYIPNGSAVAGATRAADVASVSTQAFPFTITEGSIVVAFDTFDKDDFAPLYLGTTTTGSPNIFYFGSNFTGAIHGYAATVITNNAATFPTSNVVKAAYGFSSGSSNFTVNGTNSANNTQAITVANNSPMYLGSRGTDFFLNGHVRQITYLPRRISNAELQSRTQ